MCCPRFSYAHRLRQRSGEQLLQSGARFIIGRQEKTKREGNATAAFRKRTTSGQPRNRDREMTRQSFEARQRQLSACQSAVAFYIRPMEESQLAQYLPVLMLGVLAVVFSVGMLV